MSAKCPISNCSGFDNAYLNDDLTFHNCDVCGATWKTYDPQKRVEECFDIKIKDGEGE